jgi:hypothetical protein
MHGMNKAKTIYYKKNGDMVKSTRYENKSELIKSDIEPGTVVHRKGLKLTDITWLNTGVTFWFVDENKRGYPMTDSVFRDYIRENPIEFGDVGIEFLQRGDVYSIGFVEENKE